MQITKIHKIILSAVAVAGLLTVYIVFDRRARSAEVSIPKSEELSTTTSSGSQVITNPNGTIITIEKITPSVGNVIPKPIPDLNRPIIQSPLAKITPADLSSAIKKVKELQSLLKTNPANFPVWMDLAMYQKLGGDYDGAIISWKYAGRLAPTDFVSLGNLGNLYAYYLKDNGQAEIYYKQAIVKGPTQVYLYVQLAEVYTDIFKDMDKALAIITQGLTKIPNDPNLLQLQSSLK